MRLFHQCLLCLLCLLTALSCDDEQAALLPGISEVSISKDTVMQSATPHEDFFKYNFTLIDQSGEPAFSSDTDTMELILKDLRTFPSFNLIYQITKVPTTPYVEVIDGRVEVQISTTCCIRANSQPCTPVAGAFEPVIYEVIYANNFGLDLPKDTISFVVDCSF